MSKVLVVNRQNNMGDAMCQMRALKEYKERRSDITLDFVTCFYLHWIMANHTDLFENIYFEPDVVGFMAGHQHDELIEFTVDWGKAVNEGILKSWCETTLKFTPSTDRPYFLLTSEEEVTALNNFRQIKYNDYASEQQNSPRFRKIVVFQPESVSDPMRCFKREDWEEAISLFPDDVAIVYFCPLTRWFEAQVKPISTRSNFIMLPGYPVGTSAAFMKHVDCIFSVHSGTIMLAHAVGARNILQINFVQGGGFNLVKRRSELRSAINEYFGEQKEIKVYGSDKK